MVALRDALFYHPQPVALLQPFDGAGFVAQHRDQLGDRFIRIARVELKVFRRRSGLCARG
jgi:hypothetical protein